jgi:glycolate oxidase FAD binding subunit
MMGGTVTGEHGVGVEKLNSMCVQFSTAERAQMLAIKAAFDPAGLLNPGKVIPTCSAARSMERCTSIAGRCAFLSWVGGMVAAGLAGPARAGVGPLRDFVLGASILSGSGEVLTFGGQVMKNVAGYDVSRVMAGSWGVLGLLCEVSLKVLPIPPAFRTLCFELDEAAALRQLTGWAGKAIPLHASAWHHGELYVRLAGAPSVVTGADLTSGREVAPQAAEAWWTDIRDHRHVFFELSPAKLEAGECLWRLAVPDTAPRISLPGEQFIEWGGGQRWWRGAAPAMDVRAAAKAVGGHATLVRALDKSPGAFSPVSSVSMRIQERLKQSFDPEGVFNPGRLYPEL